MGRMRGTQPDMKKVEENETGLKDRLAGYEKILEKQKWIGGDNLTLVDLFHLPFGTIVTEVSVNTGSSNISPYTYL